MINGSILREWTQLEWKLRKIARNTVNKKLRVKIKMFYLDILTVKTKTFGWHELQTKSCNDLWLVNVGSWWVTSRWTGHPHTPHQIQFHVHLQSQSNVHCHLSEFPILISLTTRPIGTSYWLTKIDNDMVSFSRSHLNGIWLPTCLGKS